MTDTVSGDAAIEMYKGQRSILVIVVARSGRGKSFGQRNLNPETSHIINVMGKPLPFPKGMQFSPSRGNMTIAKGASEITRAMKDIEDHVDVVSVDDSQYIMATEFMDKAMQKGYDKFTIMARNFWDILLTSLSLKDGLKVFILAHEDDSGTERKMKTLGKLLDEKMTPEGLSSIVLYGDVEIGDAGKRKYFLSTQTDGRSNAKSPFGMFPQEIPNDLDLVAKRIDEYYSGVELKDSKLNFNIDQV